MEELHQQGDEDVWTIASILATADLRVLQNFPVDAMEPCRLATLLDIKAYRKCLLHDSLVEFQLG